LKRTTWHRENVFDFIVGDIVEASIIKDSYEVESANSHFLNVCTVR